MKDLFTARTGGITSKSSLLLSSLLLCAFASQASSHDNMNATLWYQTSAEFKASAIQTYQTASLQLAPAIADKRTAGGIEAAAKELLAEMQH